MGWAVFSTIFHMLISDSFFKMDGEIFVDGWKFPTRPKHKGCTSWWTNPVSTEFAGRRNPAEPWIERKGRPNSLDAYSTLLLVRHSLRQLCEVEKALFDDSRCKQKCTSNPFKHFWIGHGQFLAEPSCWGTGPQHSLGRRAMLVGNSERFICQRHENTKRTLVELKFTLALCCKKKHY